MLRRKTAGRGARDGNSLWWRGGEGCAKWQSEGGLPREMTREPRPKVKERAKNNMWVCVCVWGVYLQIGGTSQCQRPEGGAAWWV